MSLFDRLIEWLAPRPAKAWPVDNQIEAQAFSLILQEEGIPHRVRRNGEALWGYAEQVQEGWGQIEVPAEHWDRVEALYRDFQASEPEAD